MRRAVIARSIVAVLLAIGMLLAGSAAPAAAHPRHPRSQARALAGFWRELLSKTNAEARPTICLRFGHRMLTPFILGYAEKDAPLVTHVECDARAGERLFMTGFTDAEVSSGTPGWTPESLRKTALKAVQDALPAATYDGRPLRLPLVVTRLTRATLPEEDNLLMNHDRSTFFVAAAWVTTIPLRPGTHTVVINASDGKVYTTTLHVSC